MKLFTNLPEFQAWRNSLVGSVGLVPTMGYLHAGHLSLVEAAHEENAHVIVTIFVNPTQFAATEDLSSYPRDFEGDLRKLEQSGKVTGVFAPTPEQVYPHGFQTSITVANVSQGLEGASRPGHFVGVATVVAKLFNMSRADKAYFGQKDAQQVAVIRRMVADLNIPIDVRVCPIMRESDGLAMSSRNAYLTPQEREAASILHDALVSAAIIYDAGLRDPQALRDQLLHELAKEPLAQVDYVSVANAHTLEELHTESDAPYLLSLAVKIGKPRLLDNMLLPHDLNTMEGVSGVLGNPSS
jgi:pantoate--beta-alanine ligase